MGIDFKIQNLTSKDDSRTERVESNDEISHFTQVILLFFKWMKHSIPKQNMNEWGYIAHIGLTGPGEPPVDVEMN